MMMMMMKMTIIEPESPSQAEAVEILQICDWETSLSASFNDDDDDDDDDGNDYNDNNDDNDDDD